ncbi:MAG: hypothetical protein IJ641_07160 [Lachnospiraceae bacterium]|nr:hypothetical protein [Lachnospiraceae bacterium]
MIKHRIKFPLCRKRRRKLLRILEKACPGKAGLASLGIFAAFGALMYFKSRLIPKYADDYPYSFIWEGEHNGNLAFGEKDYKRVKSLSDLARSQWSHYLTWDGRTIAESLVQLFLISDDKKYFDLANTTVMMAQLLVCASMGEGRLVGPWSITPAKALLLSAGFFFCAPHLIATCFWLTGSMNYLWMGLLQSLFVLPYSLNYHDSGIKVPSGLIFLQGLLAGWSTETGAGAALMASVMAILNARSRGRVPGWMVWGMAGAITGLMLLLLAPGNREKLRIEKEESDTLPGSLDEMLPGYVPADYMYTPLMFKLWFRDGFMATIIRELPLQIPVLIWFMRGGMARPAEARYVLALEAITLCIPSVMMLSPEYPRRATYPSIIYLLPAASIALKHIGIPDIQRLRPALKLAANSGITALGIRFVSSLIMDADLSSQMDKQVRYIRANRDREHDTVRGVFCRGTVSASDWTESDNKLALSEEEICLEDVALPPLYEKLAGDRSITDDVLMGVCLDNPDDPYNMAAAAYYGVPKIYCGSNANHKYNRRDINSIIFGVINPVRSLISKIAGMLSDIRRAPYMPGFLNRR